MPFITEDRRKIIDEEGFSALKDPQPGDRCYFYYRDMVKRWKANPRWSTAHEIYKGMMFRYGLRWVPPEDQAEWDAAHLLAWQVFFQLHVIPYEIEKREDNGDI